MSESYLRRDFYWRWPHDGMAWFFWAHQNYGSNWIVWRVGPINYCVEIAQPGECSYRPVKRPGLLRRGQAGGRQ